MIEAKLQGNVTEVRDGIARISIQKRNKPDIYDIIYYKNDKVEPFTNIHITGTLIKDDVDGHSQIVVVGDFEVRQSGYRNKITITDEPFYLHPKRTTPKGIEVTEGNLYPKGTEFGGIWTVDFTATMPHKAEGVIYSTPPHEYVSFMGVLTSRQFYSKKLEKDCITTELIVTRVEKES